MRVGDNNLMGVFGFSRQLLVVLWLGMRGLWGYCGEGLMDLPLTNYEEAIRIDLRNSGETGVGEVECVSCGMARKGDRFRPFLYKVTRRGEAPLWVSILERLDDCGRIEVEKYQIEETREAAEAVAGLVRSPSSPSRDVSSRLQQLAKQKEVQEDQEFVDTFELLSLSPALKLGRNIEVVIGRAAPNSEDIAKSLPTSQTLRSPSRSLLPFPDQLGKSKPDSTLSRPERPSKASSIDKSTPSPPSPQRNRPVTIKEPSPPALSYPSKVPSSKPSPPSNPQPQGIILERLASDVPPAISLRPFLFNRTKSDLKQK